MDFSLIQWSCPIAVIVHFDGQRATFNWLLSLSDMSLSSCHSLLPSLPSHFSKELCFFLVEDGI